MIIINSRSSHFLALLAIAVAASVLYLPWLDDNHRWWGDFALYMAHAKNITEGLPYADTGYVVNPDLSWLSPPAYPPVFSVLLVPVYGLFGMNLVAPKVLLFVFFLIFVALFQRYCASRLTTTGAIVGATLVVAISPWFWEMKNLILSDIPFVLFTFGSVLIISRTHDRAPGSRGYRLWPLMLGIMFYLSYGTRSLGITLPIALVIFDLLKLRRVRFNTFITLAVFLVCYILQNLLLETDKSYATAMVSHAMRSSGEAPADLFQRGMLLLQSLLDNLENRTREYAWIFQAYWDNGYLLTLRLALALLAGVLAVTGFVSAARKDFSFAEVFVVVYLGLLLVVPFIQGYRYLLPLTPLFVLYVFVGTEVIAGSVKRRWAAYMPIAVTLFISLSHLGYYTTQYPPSAVSGVKDPEAVELYDYIRRNTAEEAVVIHDKPRIIALFTGRHASAFQPDHSAAEMWAFFKAVNASYLIFNTGNPIADYATYNGLMKQSADRLDLVFENAAFRIYRIESTEQPSPPESAHDRGHH